MTKLLRKLHDTAFAGIRRLPVVAPALSVRPGLAGFFGQVFTTLNGIRFAELNRLRANVFWGQNSPYFEAEKGPNAWNYYFETTDFDFSGRRCRSGLSLPYRPGAHDYTPNDGLSVRQSVGHALKAWCQPRPEIVEAVAAFAHAHFGTGQMLGVHVRLTDAAAGAEERRTVGLNTFFSAVDAWMSISSQGNIYLATDDSRVVAAFEQRYPGRVSFQDCLRSQDGTSIHGHYDAGVAGSPYQKGLEVLVDALLLARCNQLVRTHSRVTAFGLCWNLDLSFRDLEREVLGVDRTPWLHV